MVVMTRRNAICASSVALATPLAGKLVAGNIWQPGGSGAPQSATLSSSGSGRLSADLQAYVVSDVPRLLANIHKGQQLTPHDYQNLSDRLHLFGRHIGSIDTEPFRKGVVASFKPSSAIDLSQQDGAKQAYARLLRHDPGLSSAEFQQSLTLSPEQAEEGRKLLAARPIAGHFHDFADSLKDIGSGIGAGLLPLRLDPGSPSGLLSAAVYHPGTGFHLEKVQGKFCGLTKKQWCQLLGGAAAFGLTLVAIAGAVSTGPVAASVAALAAALGWSVADLVIFARLGAAISGFITLLCGIFL